MFGRFPSLQRTTTKQTGEGQVTIPPQTNNLYEERKKSQSARELIDVNDDQLTSVTLFTLLKTIDYCMFL